MSTINFANLTWSGREVDDISQMVYEKAFPKPELSAIHTLQTGIKAKQQIGYFGHLGLVGKKDSGCSTTENTSQITPTQKFWEPAPIFDRFSQCYSTLLPSFFVWGLKNGVNKSDLTQTDFADFFTTVLADAMREAVYRIAWFGQTDHTVVGHGSGSQLLTAGTDAGFFTPINGFWKQVFDIIASDSKRRYTIAENTGADYDAQELTADKGLTIFKELKHKADPRLRASSDLVYLCTDSITDNYADTLRGKNVDTSFKRIEGGYNTLSFEGIPIISVNHWDRTIDAYFDNGTIKYNPHRALLTTRDNIALGVEEESNLSDIRVWYSQDDRKFRAEFLFNLDGKVIEDHMIQAAY